jgi:hypothetical protein
MALLGGFGHIAREADENDQIVMSELKINTPVERGRPETIANINEP